MAKEYLIRFTIKDPDGNNEYDICDEFIADLDCVKGKKSKKDFNKELRKAFDEKIKAAVKEWFKADPEEVKYEIDNYGYGYDFESESEDWDSEDKYVLSRFPARCVSHIPEKIMKQNGFRPAPEPSLDEEFYHDDGFLLD